MANPSKNHFGKTILNVSEQVHRAVGHSPLGKVATLAIAGSAYRNYVQLDFISKGITADIKDSVTVPGDPEAGIVPRFWNKALVMAAPNTEINVITAEYGLLRSQHAIAYISEDVVRVGYLQHDNPKDRFLFGHLYETGHPERTIAMRLGKGSLTATMGVWIPEEYHFISAENVRVVEANVSTTRLQAEFSETKLA